jgi:hypothetical protein
MTDTTKAFEARKWLANQLAWEFRLDELRSAKAGQRTTERHDEAVAA